MKNLNFTETIATLLVVFAFAFAAAAQTPQDVEKLEPKLREIFSIWDENGDGVIDGTEYEKWSGAKHYDKDEDGTLTAIEYDRYFHPKPAENKTAAGNAIAPPVKSNSAPPAGKYGCYNIRAKMSGGYDFVFMGFLTIKSPSDYAWFEESGKFRVFETDRIEWLTGTLNQEATETKFKTEKNTHVIEAKFKQEKDNYLLYTCSLEIK